MELLGFEPGMPGESSDCLPLHHCTLSVLRFFVHFLFLRSKIANGFIILKKLLNDAHCVLLKHYYSVDFPWWFDRKISFFSLLSKTADNMMIRKKIVKWQKFKTALCDLTNKMLLLNFVSMQFWTEISNQSGSQIHAWILLKKKCYYIRIYSIFCRASPFHREWPQLATILTSFDLPFEKKFKSLKY